MKFARVSAVCAGVVLAFPFAVLAFPFGGEISEVVNCFNDAIYANIGPPVAGPYIWTPATVTYQFGPPSHAGQWLLGLAGAPYYCLVSIEPIIVWTGIDITMMGSSGPAAPAAPSQAAPSSLGSSDSQILQQLLTAPECNGTNAGNCKLTN